MNAGRWSIALLVVTGLAACFAEEPEKTAPEKTVTFKGSRQFGPLTEEDLAYFERRLGARLPDDYRQFLLKHNGGDPEPGSFKIGEKDSSTLHHIYGLHEGPSWARLDWAWRCYRGRMPDNLLPIADDWLGNAICLSVKGADQGRLYFWDHEKEAGNGEKPSYQNCTLIASGFSDLIANLYRHELKEPNPPADEKPWERACRTGDLTALKELLKAGLNVNEKSKYGLTPIEIASFRGHIELVKLLATGDAQRGYSLELATRNGRLEVAKYLIDCGEKPDAQMMITAIKDYGATDTVKFLLDNGVDPNSRDEKDTTAIELAVRHEHTNIVRLLVDHKAKVGVPWVSANKLLISGCINGQSQIVKMMLACGADPNARGMDGNSAAELAAQCEHPRVLRVLMDAGAKATTPELEKIFAELKAKPAK